MAARNRVRDRDRGMRTIVAAIGDTKGRRVEAGWFSNAPRPVGATGLTMAGLAAVHEFGAPSVGVPARPMLRPVADSRRARWRRVLLDTMRAALLRGRRDAGAAALATLGGVMEADIKRHITTLRSPPLRPATVAAKGSSNPLIDTGAMRDAVDHRSVGVGRGRGQ